MKKPISLVVLGSVLSVSAIAAEPVPGRVSPPPKTMVMSSQESYSGEDWKGQPENSDLSLGALAGLGIHGGSAGFVLLGTASKKISNDGFIPDINDSTSIEFQGGPFWVSGATLFNFSAHLRWDFRKNDSWTFYALGGLGGDAGGGDFVIFPRVGVGAFYDMARIFVLRAEVSHEVLGVGVTFPFWF